MGRRGFRSRFVSTEENPKAETKYLKQPRFPRLPILAVVCRLMFEIFNEMLLYNPVSVF